MQQDKSKRKSEQHYVLGALLGYVDNSGVSSDDDSTRVNITNCYGIPYKTEEIESLDSDGQTVKKHQGIMDMDYDNKMRSLLTKGTGEKVVGMFYVR